MNLSIRGGCAHSQRKELGAFFICGLLSLYPPAYAYFSGGLSNVFNFLAADTFYYLSIAANSSFLAYTFDGQFLTNGFHPLWQILLERIAHLPSSPPSRETLVVLTFWMSVGLTSF